MGCSGSPATGAADWTGSGQWSADGRLARALGPLPQCWRPAPRAWPQRRGRRQRLLAARWAAGRARRQLLSTLSPNQQRQLCPTQNDAPQGSENQTSRKGMPPGSRHAEAGPPAPGGAGLAEAAGRPPPRSPRCARFACARSRALVAIRPTNQVLRVLLLRRRSKWACGFPTTAASRSLFRRTASKLCHATPLWGLGGHPETAGPVVRTDALGLGPNLDCQLGRGLPQLCC